MLDDRIRIGDRVVITESNLEYAKVGRECLTIDKTYKSDLKYCNKWKEDCFCNKTDKEACIFVLYENSTIICSCYIAIRKIN